MSHRSFLEVTLGDEAIYLTSSYTHHSLFQRVSLKALHPQDSSHPIDLGGVQVLSSRIV